MNKGSYSNYFEVPSGYRGSKEDLLQLNAAKLMETALFRVSPHFLRMKVYNNGNWLLSSKFKNENSVFQLDPATSRRRNYFLYSDNRITKYWIDGSVYDAHSCVEAGSKEIEQVREFYTMGTKINFGIQGNADAIAEFGWGPQLNGHSWSKAEKAGLQLLLADTDLHTNLDMDLTFKPFIHKEKLPLQHIRVSVNGTPVDEWIEQTGKIQERQILIPADAIHSN
jgi:hypothetical protein